MSGWEYDAHECLIQISSRVYSEINNECLFKVTALESTVCQLRTCSWTEEKIISNIYLGLDVEESVNVQIVTGMLTNIQAERLQMRWRWWWRM